VFAVFWSLASTVNSLTTAFFQYFTTGFSTRLGRAEDTKSRSFCTQTCREG
jgi:hypothetical protein